MDVLFEQQWRTLLDTLETRFGGGMDLQDILYLVGVQEHGQGFRKFKKQEKMDLMHVAVCTVLVPQASMNSRGGTTTDGPISKRRFRCRPWSRRNRTG